MPQPPTPLCLAEQDTDENTGIKKPRMFSMQGFFMLVGFTQSTLSCRKELLLLISGFLFSSSERVKRDTLDSEE